MKYLAITEQQTLTLQQTDQPICTPSQCLVKVKAIGINRADILQKQGMYPAPAGESTILGLEVAGEIVELGSQCHQWVIGQAVFGLVAGGGYAEYVAVEAEHLMPVPSDYSFMQAAAIAETFLTAYQSLFQIAKLKAKQTVLIHAGASGVGSAAIQLAKAKQCQVVVTVGTEQKGEACISLGADHYINYRQQDFVEWSQQHQPQGFDVILDVVGADYLPKNINVATLDGAIVMLAMLGGRYSEQIDIAKLLGKRLSIHASTLRNRSQTYKTELINAFKDEFLADFSTGKLTPVIDTVYPWQQVEQAHQRMEHNQNIGKLVLTVD